MINNGYLKVPLKKPLVQCRHEQRVSRQRGLPVPGIIPKAGIAKAKTAKTVKSTKSIRASARNGAAARSADVFRNANAYATDGCNALRDKDIHEGKNPHGCGRILPACQLSGRCLYLMLCATV